MRFYFGKKIGGMYVGTSVKGSTVGKVILYFFTWPFILLYFILIWPFVKLYQHNKKKKNTQYLVSEKTVYVDNEPITMSPAQAKTAYSRYQQIAEESAKLMQETKNPDVYFSRYDTTIENFKLLSAAYQICGVDNNVEEDLQTLKKNRTIHTNAFIDRYAKDTRRKIYELTTTKGKANKAEVFKNVLLEYKNQMTPESLEYVEQKYGELKELATTK